MYIALRDFVLMKDNCGEFNRDFAEIFGNGMELTQQNVDLLSRKCGNNFYEYAFDNIVPNLDEKKYMELASYLEIDCCHRCWQDALDDVLYALVKLPNNRKNKAIVELLPFVMKVIN